jgi:hypothetical protein
MALNTALTADQEQTVRAIVDEMTLQRITRLAETYHKLSERIQNAEQESDGVDRHVALALDKCELIMRSVDRLVDLVAARNASAQGVDADDAPEPVMLAPFERNARCAKCGRFHVVDDRGISTLILRMHDIDTPNAVEVECKLAAGLTLPMRSIRVLNALGTPATACISFTCVHCRATYITSTLDESPDVQNSGADQATTS